MHLIVNCPSLAAIRQHQLWLDSIIVVRFLRGVDFLERHDDGEYNDIQSVPEPKKEIHHLEAQLSKLIFIKTYMVIG